MTTADGPTAIRTNHLRSSGVKAVWPVGPSRATARRVAQRPAEPGWPSSFHLQAQANGVLELPPGVAKQFAQTPGLPNGTRGFAVIGKPPPRIPCAAPQGGGGYPRRCQKRRSLHRHCHQRREGTAVSVPEEGGATGVKSTVPSSAVKGTSSGNSGSEVSVRP